MLHPLVVIVYFDENRHLLVIIPVEEKGGVHARERGRVKRLRFKLSSTYQMQKLAAQCKSAHAPCPQHKYVRSGLAEQQKDWTHNTDALFRKPEQAPPPGDARVLWSEGATPGTCCDSVVASAIWYGVACWSSSTTERERKKLDKIIKEPGSVLGRPLDGTQGTEGSRSNSHGRWTRL